LIKVLLVEDETIIRQLLRCSVDWFSLGCSVVGEADNGETGFILMESLQPQLVITDIRMPGISGIEMLERAQNLYEFKSVILSGYDEFSYAQKAISLGNVVGYILKPIDEEKFCETVRRAVDAILSRQSRHVMNLMPSEGEMDHLITACQDYYVKKVLLAVRNHYREHLSIESLAEELDISPGYLSKRFKAETSLTFVGALQRYRVQKSIALIELREKKIYEVAEDVGYASYKRFCEVFKQVTSLSPSEFAASLDHFTQRREKP
jgi:two-component system response regulator YesN